MIFTFEQCCGAGAGGAEIIWGPEAVAEKKNNFGSGSATLLLSNFFVSYNSRKLFKPKVICYKLFNARSGSALSRKAGSGPA